jgi:3-oxoadipate enol-lactonase
MKRISRRHLLNLSCTSLGAFGIASSVEGKAPSKLVSDTESYRGGIGGPHGTDGSGPELFFRDDWLGAPWLTPEPVLLIHGNDESSVSWFGWVPRMAVEYRLIRPDLPGFGHSPILPNYEWSMAGLAATLAKLLDRLGISSAHIIGAKTGGAIAMQFAADYPQRTRTLVLVSAPVTRVDSKIAFAAPSATSQRKRLGSSASKELIDYWNTMMSSTSTATKAGIAIVEANLDMMSVLPKIAAPTLVITSDRSGLQPVEVVLHYQQKIPNSQLLVLPSDGYHVAVVKAGECVTSVLSFIAEQKRDSPGKWESAAPAEKP